VLALAKDVVPPESHAGPPLPAFLDVVDDAAWWDGIASDYELKAYLFACFLSLPQKDRAKFLALAKRRVAAWLTYSIPTTCLPR
jgi:hypothetical protein